MSHPPNETCSVDDCGKAAKRAGLCEGHRKRKQKGSTVSRPLRQWGDPRRTLMEAAFAYTDAKRFRDTEALKAAAEGFAEASDRSEAAYHRAWRRLYVAAKRLSGTK